MTSVGVKSLIVWQKSMDFAVAMYQATESFPKSEQYGLTSQLRRAAYSPPSNIAEGYGRHSWADQDRFHEIADGSLAECETFLILSHRLGYFTTEKFEELEQKRAEVARLLNGFRRRPRST